MKSVKRSVIRSALLLLLAAFVFLSAVSCAEKPSGTAASDSTPPPVIETARPTEAYREKPIFFDPETDYDNRYSSLIVCDMVETEDAYYLHNRDTNGFLYYYDRPSGESGVLCPRPECEHDAIRENRACTGYLGYDYPSLQYYQGKLWFFESSNGRKFRLCHMNLDGSEKTLVHEFDPTGTPLDYGNRRLHIHRGMIYHSCFDQKIEDAAVFHRICYGCIPMTDTVIGGQKVKAWEYYSILELDTIHMPQPTMYFAGDYAYMFYSYDGLSEYDGEGTEEDFYEWKRTIPVADEIARWEPDMTEPEIIYHSTETYPMLWSYFGSYVTKDGTPYIVDSERADPEQPYGDDNPYYLRLYRIEKDGTRTCVLDTSGEPGDAFLLALSDGVIVLADTSIMNLKGYNTLVGVRIFRFGGEKTELIFEGQLPLEYRGSMHIGMKDMRISAAWVTEDTLMIFSDEYYGRKDYDCSWHFVKYDVTPEELIETVLSEGYEVQFWKSN